MKVYVIQFLFILIINYSSQQRLDLQTFETEHYPINTGTWKDLLGIKVECENRGVLKNFVLRKDDSYFWYEYQCYSSDKYGIEEGEPIVKGLTLKSSYKYSITIQENIRTLNTYPVDCWIDYGLMSFMLYNDNGVLRREAVCHGLKSKVTKINVESSKKTALATKIDGLVDITVGSTEEEDDENIAYVLYGFKYKIDTSSSNERPTVSYIYKYTILRNMEVVKNRYKEDFEKLRNGNTQKN